MLPIRIFASLTIVATGYALWSMLRAAVTGTPVHGWAPDAFHPVLIAVVLAGALAQVALAVAILRGARWSYPVLRGWLYVWLVAAPLGTLVAWPLLRCMRREEVRRHFGVGTPA